MDAKNSFFIKFIATYAPTFFGYIISVLAMVTGSFYKTVSEFWSCLGWLSLWVWLGWLVPLSWFDWLGSLEFMSFLYFFVSKYFGRNWLRLAWLRGHFDWLIFGCSKCHVTNRLHQRRKKMISNLV